MNTEQETFGSFAKILKEFKEQGYSVVLLCSRIECPWATIIDRFGILDHGKPTIDTQLYIISTLTRLDRFYYMEKHQFNELELQSHYSMMIK